MKILFLGRKAYSGELIKWLIERGHTVVGVVTDSHFPNSPTAEVAKYMKIPIFDLEEVESLISNGSIEVDLVVSYLFWRKIKEPLITKPKFKCINFHPAPLPNWRGTAGYNVAILEKLTKWAATAHYVDEKIDTGDIIRLFEFAFDYRLETALTLEQKTQVMQMDLFKSVILDVEKKGILDSKPQSSTEGKYISRDQMEKMKLLSLESDDIDLKIRAFWFPPYQGAYIDVKGKKYTLINQEILNSLKSKNATHL